MVLQAHDMKLRQRKSGLIVPADADVPDEKCKHKDVEALHKGYKCKGCHKTVVMVTIQTQFMTFEEVSEWQKQKKAAQRIPRL